MLTLTNRTIKEHNDDSDMVCTITRYDAEGYAECDFSGLWGYDGDAKVPVSAVEIYEEDYGDGDTSTMIYVEHNAGGTGDWRIYTDKGFMHSISEALGFDVTFTEQGMQDDGVASLET
jgi:hypothetical protein